MFLGRWVKPRTSNRSAQNSQKWLPKMNNNSITFAGNRGFTHRKAALRKPGDDRSPIGKACVIGSVDESGTFWLQDFQNNRVAVIGGSRLLCLFKGSHPRVVPDNASTSATSSRISSDVLARIGFCLRRAGNCFVPGVVSNSWGLFVVLRPQAFRCPKAVKPRRSFRQKTAGRPAIAILLFVYRPQVPSGKALNKLPRGLR